jgi:hypothetical protein
MTILGSEDVVTAAERVEKKIHMRDEVEKPDLSDLCRRYPHGLFVFLN